MSETKAGNIEAIRDWSRRYFYTKNEIADKFIENSQLDLSNSVWQSGSTNVLLKDGRFVKAGNNDGYYSVMIPVKPDLSNVYINPFGASGNPFKISIRFKIFDATLNSYLVLFGCPNNLNGLPCISINGPNKKIYFNYSIGGSAWDYSEDITITNLQTDTWYRVENEWDGQKWYNRVFDADDNLVNLKETNIMTPWYYDATYFPSIGGTHYDRNCYPTGVMFDLANTYWTANGDIVWGTDLYRHEW